MDSSNYYVGQEASVQAKEELFESEIHIMNHLNSSINFMSLRCALDLGIFEAIHNNNNGRPMSILDLSQVLSLPQQKARYLPRLMRILAHSGYFFVSTTNSTVDDDIDRNYYSLTSTGTLLLKNHPFTKRTDVFTFNSNMDRPWLLLSEWFRSDQPDSQTPFAFANNGVTFWEIIGGQSEANAAFNEAMARDSKLHTSVLLDINNIPLLTKFGKLEGFFSGLRSLVDVGGGTGEMAKAIAQTYPNIMCTVLDLPQVNSGLKETHNLKFIAGSMFEGVPPAEAVLLKWVLHNWSDENSLKILKECREAITENDDGSSGQHGKVIIIDMVLPDDISKQKKDKHKFIETQLFFDMMMLVLVGGKERTEKEWKQLFQDAGFTGGYKIYPLLGLRSLIEVYP